MQGTKAVCLHTSNWMLGVHTKTFYVARLGEESEMRRPPLPQIWQVGQTTHTFFPLYAISATLPTINRPGTLGKHLFFLAAGQRLTRSTTSAGSSRTRPFISTFLVVGFSLVRPSAFLCIGDRSSFWSDRLATKPSPCRRTARGERMEKGNVESGR